MSEAVYALAQRGHLADYSFFTGRDHASGVKVDGTEARYQFRDVDGGTVHSLSRFASRLSPAQAQADFDRAIVAFEGT